MPVREGGGPPYSASPFRIGCIPAMSEPPDQTGDPSSEPFRLQFSSRTLLVLFTVAAITWPLMQWGVPHLIALLTGPISAGMYLVKRKDQPAELGLMIHEWRQCGSE